MTKKELARGLAEKYEIPKNDADKTVDFIFDAIQKELLEDKEVSIPGFGKFQPSSRAAREGRNPATGETIQIAASKVAKFKPAKQLKEALNSK
ncbi:HU family DNA-binding protein [Spiroplasma endosymbiont of Amphibalanus improvisus]|uniref:HU family DNA-binding protein n=1 Tax=Spiroplasma endosymbiont of Amphibalanus improvisus TaxID=3066327 RepID=UPI00313C5368